MDRMDRGRDREEMTPAGSEPMTSPEAEPSPPGFRGAAANAISWYYFSTIGFLLVDLIFGWNIRVAALEGTPLLKYTWYSGLLGCGIFIRLRPDRSAVVALVESSTNLAILLGGIMMTYYGAVDMALAGSFDGVALTSESIVNAGISGFALVGGIYSNPLMRRASLLGEEREREG